MVGADGPESAKDARIRDILRGGGGGFYHVVKPSFDPQWYLNPSMTCVLATSWETLGTHDLFRFELWGLLWASKPNPSKNGVMGGATALGGYKSRNKSNNQPKNSVDGGEFEMR